MDNQPIFTKKSLQKRMPQLQKAFIRSTLALCLLILAGIMLYSLAGQMLQSAKSSNDTNLRELNEKQETLTEQLRTLKQERSTLVLSLDEVEKKVQSTRVELESTENLIKEEVNKNLPELHKTSERILPVQAEVVATAPQEEVKK